MIRFACNVQDFMSRQPIEGCVLIVRIIVAPRLLGTIPDLSRARVLENRVSTPPSGEVALEFDATLAFEAIEQLMMDGQAAGEPVAFVELTALFQGFELTSASPRVLKRDDEFETTVSLDFAKTLVGHTTPTTTTLWFSLHRTQQSSETFVCEIDSDSTLGNATPLQSHQTVFRAEDLNTSVVHITGLQPDTHYQYQLRRQSGSEIGQNRAGLLLTDGEFVTFSEERDARRIRFAFASCHAPNKNLKAGSEAASRRSLERWVELGRLATAECDMLFLMGDQIYADGIDENFPTDPWITRFAKRYHQQLEYREVRRIFASKPTYMILDDHEIKDDYGVEEIDDDIVTNGLLAYRAFQHSHNPGGPDGPFHYAFRRGPAAFFVLDTRSRRTPGHIGEFPVLGEAQFNAFRRWADEDARDADVAIVVTPSPFAWLPVETLKEAIENLVQDTTDVFIPPVSLLLGAINKGVSTVTSGLIFRYLSGRIDIKDQWTFAPNQRDMQRVLQVLFDLANDLDTDSGLPRPGRRKRAVFVLGGDVHMGGMHVIRSAQDGNHDRRDHRANASIYSLTSSPISHEPADGKVFQLAVEKTSDDIDPLLILTGKIVKAAVDDGKISNALGEGPASFTLDTEFEGDFSADLIGLVADRNFGRFGMRRIDAPGRYYVFTLSIEGFAESGVRTEFLLDLDADTITPMPVGPNIIASPSPVSFGGVNIGTVASRTLSLQNLSGETATISVAASLPNNVFQWDASTVEVAHGQQHTVGIRFRPIGNEIVRAQLRVTSNLLAEPMVIGVIGKGPGGFQEPPPPPQRLKLQPKSVSFGTVPLNAVRRRNLTFANETPAQIQVTIEPPPQGSPFSWEAAAFAVPGGSSRTIELSFRPRSSAIERGTLVAVSTAPDSPHRIPLLGKGPGGF